MSSDDSRTAQQILNDANELARLFYASHGYQVPEGYRFDQATHPQERAMWSLAEIAYEFLDGTELDQVIEEIEELDE